MDSPALASSDFLDRSSAPGDAVSQGLQASWQRAMADAHADAGSQTQPEGRAPNDPVQLAQLALPGTPTLPIPPGALPQSPPPTRDEWNTAIERAGRRLDYDGSEIANGHPGSAAGHLFLGTPYPPGVDDPTLGDLHDKPTPGPAGGTAAAMAAPVKTADLPQAAATAVARAKAEGCDLEFVEESSAYAQGTPWRTYEEQTPGAFTDPMTGNLIAPALHHENSNPNGAPYVRFDGFTPIPGGGIEAWQQNGETSKRRSGTKPRLRGHDQRAQCCRAGQGAGRRVIPAGFDPDSFGGLKPTLPLKNYSPVGWASAHHRRVILKAEWY